MKCDVMWCELQVTLYTINEQKKKETNKEMKKEMKSCVKNEMNFQKEVEKRGGGDELNCTLCVILTVNTHRWIIKRKCQVWYTAQQNALYVKLILIMKRRYEKKKKVKKSR